MVLCMLILVLSACTVSLVEEPDSVPGTDRAVEIEFVESAPKDRFVITNLGPCAVTEFVLELDLSESAGKLIFDTTAAGEGVEVYQPFEVESGDIDPLAANGVNDGDAKLTLNISNLAPDESASFTIDVDDTLPIGELGQIRVSDAEISGGIVSIVVADSEVARAAFDSQSIARVTLPPCPPAE